MIRSAGKTVIIIMAIFSILILALIGGTGSAAASAGDFSMKVASTKMYAYGSAGLDGVSIAVYKQGDIIRVRKYNDGVYCIVGETGVKGYCSPIDLVNPDSLIFYQAPYKWSEDIDGTTLISDMEDFALYIYENDTSLDMANNDIIFLQKRTIEKLEKAVENFSLNYTLRVAQGYLPSSVDPGYEVSSNTGCVVMIKVYYKGIEQNISHVSFVEDAMKKAGFVPCEGYNDVFYDNDFDSYFGYDLDMNNLPAYIIG